MRRLLLLTLLAITCFAHAEDALRFSAPKKWALVIGASDYQTIGKLKYASKDATAFAEVLRTDLQFEEEDITLLADGDANAKAPTAKNILASLDRLLADPELDRGDLFVFFFSGHGVGLPSGDYLLPTDATLENAAKVGLPVKEVTKRFVAKRLRNVLIICDACRAGNENPFGSELRELGEKSNLAVLLGCAPGKRSYELPRQRQGALTGNIIRAVQDSKLRNPVSGSLWASALGAKVKEGVRLDTERDYGQYAQVPSTWNEETADVILFSSPKWIKSEAIEQEFNLLKDKPGAAKQKYVAAMSDLALGFASIGRFDLAIEGLKAADQVTDLTDRELLLLATSLSLGGRTPEADKVFARMMKSDSEYFRSLATLYTTSKSVPVAAKGKAAEVIWATDHTVQSAELAYGMQSGPAKIAFGKRVIASAKAGTKEALYWEGRIALEQLDFAKAGALLAKSAAMPGPAPLTHLACFHLNRAAGMTGNILLQQEAWRIGLGLKEYEVFWGLKFAEFLFEADPGQGTKMLSRYLSPPYTPSPAEIYDATLIAGGFAFDLLPILGQHAKAMPYAWQVRAALWFAKFVEKPSQFFDLPENVTKYAPDPLELRYDMFFGIWKAVNETELTLFQKRAYGDEFTGSILPFVDQIGDRSYIWRELSEWSIYSGRQRQLYRNAERLLFPQVLAGGAELDLASAALKVAMNSGDDATAAKIYAAYKWTGFRDEVDLRYALYLACREKNGEAAKAFAKVTRHPENRGYQEIDDGLKLLLRARAGDVAGAKKAFDTWKAETTIGLEMWALVGATVYCDIPHTNVLTKVVDYYNAETFYLMAANLRLLDKNLATLKEEEIRRGWVWLEAAYRGNPLFKEAKYVPYAKVEAYAGTYAFPTHWLGDPDRRVDHYGAFSMKIEESGKVSIQVTLEKEEKIALTGTVDQFGNVTARSTAGHEVLMKIPPVEIMKKNDIIQKNGQPITFLDRKLNFLFMHGDVGK